MSRRFSYFGDNQSDYHFLRKETESVEDPRNNQTDFIKEEVIDPRDNQGEFIVDESELVDPRNDQTEFDIDLENDNPFILSIEKSYMNKGLDFSSEVMSWIARGATPEDVRSNVMNDIGINISIAESASIVESLSRVLEATSIKNRKVIPLKSAAMDSFIKTADAKFKYKFANVYWKVKAIKDDSGKEDFYLVRVED